MFPEKRCALYVLWKTVKYIACNGSEIIWIWNYFSFWYNGPNIAASQSFIFHSAIFLFLLCHFGEGEKNLTCKGPLREFEFDKNKLLSVEELEPIVLGILLLFLNLFLFCGASTIRFFFAFLSLVFFSAGCLSQDQLQKKWPVYQENYLYFVNLDEIPLLLTLKLLFNITCNSRLICFWVYSYWTNAPLFSDIFKGYRNGSLAWDGVKHPDGMVMFQLFLWSFFFENIFTKILLIIGGW